jgi:hypothetical protein
LLEAPNDHTWALIWTHFLAIGLGLGFAAKFFPGTGLGFAPFLLLHGWARWARFYPFSYPPRLDLVGPTSALLSCPVLVTCWASPLLSCQVLATYWTWLGPFFSSLLLLGFGSFVCHVIQPSSVLRPDYLTWAWFWAEFPPPLILASFLPFSLALVSTVWSLYCSTVRMRVRLPNSHSVRLPTRWLVLESYWDPIIHRLACLYTEMGQESAAFHFSW